MSRHRKIRTSADVWAVIKARHGDELNVFSSYSAPQGDRFGDPSTAVMMTEYGFKGAAWPLLGARTTWDVDATPRKEVTEYWLCIPLEDGD